MGKDQNLLFLSPASAENCSLAQTICKTISRHFGVDKPYCIKSLLLLQQSVVVLIAGVKDDCAVAVFVAVLAQLLDAGCPFNSQWFYRGAHTAACRTLGPSRTSRRHQTVQKTPMLGQDLRFAVSCHRHRRVSSEFSAICADSFQFLSVGNYYHFHSVSFRFSDISDFLRFGQGLPLCDERRTLDCVITSMTKLVTGYHKDMKMSTQLEVSIHTCRKTLVNQRYFKYGVSDTFGTNCAGRSTLRKE